MMRRLLLASLLALTLVALPGHAQTPSLGTITVAIQDATVVVPAEGSTSIEATVTVDCALAIAEMGTTQVAIAGTADNLTVGTDSMTIDPQACLTGMGSISKVANLTLTANPAAPGLTPIPITVAATLGTTNGSDTTDVTVAYRPGHTITPDVTFPVTVTGESFTFNLTLEYTGNARSMIMFEDQDCEGCTVTGLQPIIRQPPATETIQVTFKPAAKDWDNATFEFRNFSHYLLESGDAGDPELEEFITWTFVQGDPPGKENGKDSPGLGLVALLAGLAAAAVVVRRR